MSAEIVKLGTLCIDSWPVESGTKCNSDSSPLAIVNTVPGKEIQWVQVGGLLIADRCVCTNISWSRLAKLGYISGKLLQIDGKKFFCRSLKLGNAPDKPSEWDRILDLTGEDDSLWHWKNRCSWGQETVDGTQNKRAVVGGYSARSWTHFSKTFRGITAGFRPVLEPLDPMQDGLKSLIGKKISIYGPTGWTISGKLVRYDNYDLVLEECSYLPDLTWASKVDGELIIDRNAVEWLREP